VTFSAGPFSVVASAYASAGAEARASGIIGFEDGKLKIGGSAGAALGIGGGASATVEIDVAQIGQMAKNVADVNDDGKVDLWDAASAVSKTAKFAVRWLSPPAPKTSSRNAFVPFTLSPFPVPGMLFWSPWHLPTSFNEPKRL
jgi:hypothetical protein